MNIPPPDLPPMGPSLSSEFQVRALALQKRAMTEVGEQAIKLIESASILPPDQGRRVDIRI